MARGGRSNLVGFVRGLLCSDQCFSVIFDGGKWHREDERNVLVCGDPVTGDGWDWPKKSSQVEEFSAGLRFFEIFSIFFF